MKRIFLLRAYGDFIVALQSLVNSSDRSHYEIIASAHHRALYDALPASIIPANLSIRFVDWGIRKPLLRAFTDRHILHPETLQELTALREFLRANPLAPGSDFVENIHRKWLLSLATGHRFTAIADEGLVYKAYQEFFKLGGGDASPVAPVAGSGPVVTEVAAVETVVPVDDSVAPVATTPFTAKKILILPSARITRRNIPLTIVNTLNEQHSAKGDEVTVAYFNAGASDGASDGAVVAAASVATTEANFVAAGYTNFNELIQLILQSDLVYGADSLPIHLSYLLQKPHYIIFPDGGSHQFFTPYALQHKMYKTFNQF